MSRKYLELITLQHAPSPHPVVLFEEVDGLACDAAHKLIVTVKVAAVEAGRLLGVGPHNLTSHGTAQQQQRQQQQQQQQQQQRQQQPGATASQTVNSFANEAGRQVSSMEVERLMLATVTECSSTLTH